MAQLRCSHSNYNRFALAYFLKSGQLRPTATYCERHAPIHGFCSFCGSFDESLIPSAQGFKQGKRPYGMCAICNAGQEF